MVAHAHTSPRFAFKIDGNPTSTTNKLKALGGNGPLMIATDHVLAALLPDALDDGGAANTKTIALSDTMAFVLGGCLLDGEVANNGMHLAMDPAKVSTMLQAIDDAGFDWAPIAGDTETAFPAAMERIASAVHKLPAADRTIAAGDVWYAGDAGDAGTGTWYDVLTPAMLTAGDGGPAMLALWFSIVIYTFNDEDDGRGSDAFKAILEHIEGSVGRDISGSSATAQAAAVAAWFRRTRPPANLVPWFADAAVEIERRASSTLSERFEPLFAIGWRRAYPKSASSRSPPRSWWQWGRPSSSRSWIQLDVILIKRSSLLFRTRLRLLTMV